MALTDIVMMPGADYQDICDAIREKNGQTAKIKSGEAGDLIRAIETGGGEIEMPEKITQLKFGTWTAPSGLTMSTTEITHNLGTAPNFYCIWAPTIATIGTTYISHAMGTKKGGVVIRRGTSSSNNGSFKSNETGFSLGGTYYYQANTTYIWMVGVSE